MQHKSERGQHSLGRVMNGIGYFLRHISHASIHPSIPVAFAGDWIGLVGMGYDFFFGAGVDIFFRSEVINLTYCTDYILVIVYT